MIKTLRFALGLCVIVTFNPVHAFNPLNPIKSAPTTIVVGAAGYLALQATAAYLIQHPYKIEHWMSTHPDQIEPLTKYVDHKIAEPKNEKEYAKFSKLKQDLALDKNTNAAETMAIENDPDYIKLVKITRTEINSLNTVINNSGRMPQCNMQIIEQLLIKKTQFNMSINPNLPAYQMYPVTLLNVNSHNQLKENYNSKQTTLKLTPDHIPSYGALAYYFTSHNVSIPPRAGSNLEANSTAIMIPTQLHQRGSRTYGGRNNTKDAQGNTVIAKDASNLLEGTILDIATTAYLFHVQPQYNVSAKDYIKNALILFERNKLLCLYDVK